MVVDYINSERNMGSIFTDECDLRLLTPSQWSSQLRKLEEYFRVHDIHDDTQMKAILLCVLGPQSYKLVRDLAEPLTPADKTYEEVKHFFRMA